MPRGLYAPFADLGKISKTIGIPKGGTTATTGDAAVDNIGGLKRSAIGKAGGLATLDAQQYLPVEELPSGSAYLPALVGPVSLYTKQVGTYLINNFDSATVYTLSSSAGTVSRSDDTITFTAPSTAGAVTITLNDKVISVNVVLAAPVVTGPSALSAGQTGTYTITNYDAAATYTLSATLGTATISGATITYVAGSTVGTGVITVNAVNTNVAISLAVPTISGPTSLKQGEVGTFTITNYVAGYVYNVSATLGTFTRSGATITYTAGQTIGTGTVVVNGVTDSFSVVTGVASPIISGPTSIDAGTTHTYTITNYDSSITYSVSAGIGTATRSGATITFTAGSDAGSDYIRANGTNFYITITKPASGVFGPTSIVKGEIGTFTITNYDSSLTYTVTATLGTFTRNGATITYTAGQTLGAGTITVNNATANFSVVAPYPIVTGPSTVLRGATATFTITNYDSAETYTVSCTLGTVSVNGGAISYTAGIATGQAYIIVNGSYTSFYVVQADVVITGPSSLYAGQTGIYTIANYDSTATYNVTATLGSYSRSGATITYQAGSSVGSGYLSVNNAGISISISLAVPVISGPSTVESGATGIYTITNYVDGVLYNTSATLGTYSRSGATITYKAGTTGGAGTLTVNGVVTNILVPVTTPTPVISGPAYIYVAEPGIYTITNYVEGGSYNVTTTDGTVSRNGATITFVADTDTGTAKFSVNETTFSTLNVLRTATFTGATSLNSGKSASYIITDYVSTAYYLIVTSLGDATRVGNKVTFTAGTVGGTGYLRINGTQLDIEVIPAPILSGPANVLKGSTNTCTITNYDSTVTYTVTGDLCTVSRSGATITFVTATTAGPGRIKVNDTQFNFTNA